MIIIDYLSFLVENNSLLRSKIAILEGEIQMKKIANNINTNRSVYKSFFHGQPSHTKSDKIDTDAVTDVTGGSNSTRPLFLWCGYQNFH